MYIALTTAPGTPFLPANNMLSLSNIKTAFNYYFSYILCRVLSPCNNVPVFVLCPDSESYHFFFN